MAQFLVIFVRFFVIALWLILLARVLMSWIDPRFEGRFGRFLFEMTEPFLAPIRKLLPQTGMFDLSPLIAFLLLTVLMSLVGVR